MRKKALFVVGFVVILGLAVMGNALLGSSQSGDLDRVEFSNGDVTLVGRVDFPNGSGPFPAVVRVHGSGRVTRTSAEARTETLNALGIAVLRYDKRGVGDSEGIYSTVGPTNQGIVVLNQLAGDALAAVEYLRTLPNIKSDQIGLWGGSQAGWIIPLAASQSDHVAFNAIFVGPAVSVGEEIYYSSLTGENSSQLTEARLDELSQLLANYNGPKGFDPRSSIEAMRQPTLWILGRLDASIPTRETVEILEEIIAEFGSDISIHVYPTGTHSLQDVNTGQTLPFFEEVATPWLDELLELDL